MSLVNNPVMGINFRKNTNQTSAGFGKYYPVVDRRKTLSTRGFAQHMINHGSKYGLEDIQAILTHESRGQVFEVKSIYGFIQKPVPLIHPKTCPRDSSTG